MVPPFKSKTLVTDLYSMNPPDSRGYYFFTTLYVEFQSHLSQQSAVISVAFRGIILGDCEGDDAA
jgi:hypothetical protein